MDSLASKYIRVALRSWWLILVCAATAGIVAYTITAKESVYEATATLVVGRSLQENPSEASLQGSYLLAVTYADLAVREPVLQRVAANLDVAGGWRNLQEWVEPQTLIDTPFLEITARAPSPSGAQTLANEVARQLVDIQASMNVEGSGGAERERFVLDQLEILEVKIDAAEQRVEEAQSALSGTITPDQEQALKTEVQSLERMITSWQDAYATLAGFLQQIEQKSSQLSVLSPALADRTPLTDQRYTSTAIAAVIGLLFGLVIVTLLERFRDAVNSENDVIEELGLTLLGAVRHVRGRRRLKRLFTVEGWPIRAEDYRIIRSNIMAASDSRPVRSILITSPPGGGGRTTTVANLGSVMAAQGLRTVLLDADLRQPTLHELFGLSRAPGLGDFVRSSDVDIKDITFSTPVENVSVVSSGTPLPNPSDSLDSPRMMALLTSLKRTADVVVIDSPPMLSVADAVQLAKHVDGVVLVIDAGRTGRENARKSVAALQFAGARILGAVLNRVPRQPT